MAHGCEISVQYILIVVSNDSFPQCKSQVKLKSGPVHDTSAKFQYLLDHRSSIPPHAVIKGSFQLQPVLKTTTSAKTYAYVLKYMHSVCKRYGSKGVVHKDAYTVSFEMGIDVYVLGYIHPCLAKMSSGPNSS